MGSVKYLFVTNKAGVLGADEAFIYTVRGERIPLSDLRGMILFRKIKTVADLAVPTVVVGREGIEILNLASTDGSKEINHLALEAFACDIGDLSVKVAREAADCSNIRNFRILYGLCMMERLLFNTFSAFLILYASAGIRFLPDLHKRIKVYDQDLELWELIFLPAISYALVKEIERVVNHSLEPYREPEECVNLLLSYFMGNPRFLYLFGKSLRLILRHSLAKPDQPETHGGFLPDSCELRKLGECPQPSHNLPVLRT